MTCSNFASGSVNYFGEPSIQPVIAIDPCCRLFDAGKRMNDFLGHPLFRAEGKIEQTALRLRAPVNISRHLNLAETVCFNPDFLSHVILLNPGDIQAYHSLEVIYKLSD